MRSLVRVLWTLPLLFAIGACDRLFQYRLVSEEYDFSVEFPEKPILQRSTNYQGLPKSLRTFERDASKELYCAEATSYREALHPTENWIPNKEALASLEIRVIESKRFKLRAAATGREVPAIATTAKQIPTGATLSSIYVVDGPTLISITARTSDERQKAAFLRSLTVLR